MGEAKQQASRPLQYHLENLGYHRRQEAIIGTLIMCLSTLLSKLLIQNIHSWPLWGEDWKSFLSGWVIFVAILCGIIGLRVYFDGLDREPSEIITGRNKGLIYGLGAVNISIATVLMYSEGISLAIIVLPAYIGMVIGNL